MKDELVPILCKECKNDKFVIRETEMNTLYIGCSECGKGNIFGRGVNVENILSILKEEKNKI